MSVAKDIIFSHLLLNNVDILSDAGCRAALYACLDEPEFVDSYFTWWSISKQLSRDVDSFITDYTFAKVYSDGWEESGSTRRLRDLFKSVLAEPNVEIKEEDFL